MKKISLTVITVLIVSQLFAQSKFFVKQYSDPVNGMYGKAMTPTSDGGIAMTGWAFGPRYMMPFLAKVNANGVMLFKSFLDTPVIRDLEPTGIFEVSDGYILFSGNHLVKVSSAGKFIKDITFRSRPRDSMNMDVIKKVAEGGFILAGTVNIFNSAPTVGCILRLNDNGDTLWSHYYPDYDGIYAIVETSDKGFVFTGAGSEFPITKINSSGDIVWNRSYYFSYMGSFYAPEPAALDLTSDGGIIAGANSNSTTSSGYTSMSLAKFNASGDTLWTRFISYNPAKIHQEIIDGIRQVPDGGYVVSGIRYYVDSKSRDEILIRKFNSSGKVLWDRTFKDTAAEWADFCIAKDGSLTTLADFFDKDFKTYPTLIKLNQNGDSTGIFEKGEYSTMDISLFPNPVNDNFTVKLNRPSINTRFNFKVLDIEGREVKSKENIRENSFNMNMGDCKPGIYFYTLQGEDGSVAYGKIVLAH